eukprot:5383570-Prymnesium_polylepis.1
MRRTDEPPQAADPMARQQEHEGELAHADERRVVARRPPRDDPGKVRPVPHQLDHDAEQPQQPKSAYDHQAARPFLLLITPREPIRQEHHHERVSERREDVERKQALHVSPADALTVHNPEPLLFVGRVENECHIRNEDHVDRHVHDKPAQ